jgi:hypothetical protein
MSGAEYEQQSKAARQYAIDWLAAPEIVEANARVLDRALEPKKSLVSSAA